MGIYKTERLPPRLILKMKICLVQVDDVRDYSTRLIPLGPLHVGSALKKAGYSVEIIHCTQEDIDKKAEKILEEEPLFVGFSVITGIQTLHSAIMSKRIKRKSSVPIIWGGIHPSLLPESCLKEDYIDMVVVGEGEETIIEVADMLKSKEPLGDVKGIGYKRYQNRMTSYNLNPPRPFIKNLDEYRIDFKLLNMEDYLTSAEAGGYKRITGYKSSRGCPYDCGFCYNQRFNKGQWRAYSTETVLEDIEFLKREYKIDGIRFYDDNFYVDKKRAQAILRGIGIPAYSEIRADMLDEKLAEQIKDAGCLGLLVGIESGSDRLLELVNKRCKIEDLMKKAELIAKYKLPVTYSAIIGLPTETKEETKKTIDLLLSIYDKSDKNNTVVVTGVYLPYPGTSLYSLAIKEGFNPPEATEGWAGIDRSRHEFSLPWINTEYGYRVRKYFEFLSYNIKFLNAWFKFRIKYNFFLFPLDIMIINCLSNKIIEDKSKSGKWLKDIYRSFLRGAS